MSESDPIMVFARDGRWLVDCGSYVKGFHDTRSAAVEKATDAASIERRDLVLEVEADLAAS